MTKLPTDRQQHSRHPSEGSSFNYPSNAATNAAASAAATNTTTSILPMTRLDNQQQQSQQQQQQQYQQPHPNRLIPGNNNNSNSSVNSSPISLTSSTNSTTQQQQKQQLQNIHLTRISEVAHLSSLPSEFLTHDPSRPLLHIDESSVDGTITEYKYYLNPMKSCVIFILLVEMLERFSFYGINYTTTAYLTGE